MWLLLVLLLSPAVLPAQHCGDPARGPDPAVYLALRLGGDHDLRLERHYLQRLHSTFLHPYGRDAGRPQTGRLALYLLGLRATCPTPEPPRALVTWLKYHLEEDWTGSRRHGRPLTSYYQYGLGVLALCVHHKRVREEVIRRLLTAQHHGRLGHGGTAVDTEAVVAVALTCLERRRLVGARLAAELRVAAQNMSRSMAEAQGPDGIIGNIYSTPWALQVGVTWGDLWAGRGNGHGGQQGCRCRCVCQCGGRYSCGFGADTLTPVDIEPRAEAPGNKTVRLVVECPLPWCFELRLFDQRVSAPAAASLLDVLRAASEQEPRFTFDTQDTAQGPFLTQVLGLEARQQKRNYWQLLTAPSTPLLTSVADYVPHDGETLILRLSECSVALGNLGLSYAQLDVAQAVATTTPLVTMALGALGGRRPRPLQCWAMGPVCAGAACSIAGGLRLSQPGCGFLLAATVLRALKSIQQSVLLQEDHLDALSLLGLTSLPSFVLLFGAAVALELGPSWQGVLRPDASLWGCVLLSCLGSVLYNLATSCLLSLTSALTLHLLGSLTVVGNLLLSRLLFGTRLGALGYAGVALTLAGMVLYHQPRLLAACWPLRALRRPPRHQ
ncbi:transcobalamin 2 [Willisornis vidua]|uniref:Transcobalamin-2 n=1 Tax=Willisornis vidua TaxID=1566151 RepID=A0ABQ9DRP8_9PASS|nr:transcobalamin 2 [Willisornis vidua]